VPRSKECGRSFGIEPKSNSSFLHNRRSTATVYAYKAEERLLAFIFAGDDEFISCSITALIQGQFELEGAAAVQRPRGDVRFKRKRFEIASGAMISETPFLLAAGCLWFEEPDGCVFLSA